MFAVSGIAVILFLGGWNIGFIPASLFQPGGALDSPVWILLFKLFGAVVFVLKAWILVFVMMWVRWTLPRLRIDQVMMTCLKYLLPISCVLLLGVSFWEVLVGPYYYAGLAFKVFACAACFLLFFWMAYKVVTTPSKLPGTVPPLWGLKPELAKKT
jgi:NADH-quinone oxidoreductase subunit H